MSENLIERFVLPLALRARAPLLSFEACLLRCFRGPGRSPLLRNQQCMTNEIRELFFREIAVPALAPHVAGNYPYASFGGETGSKPVEQASSLVFAQCSVPSNFPENLLARGCLLDYSSTCSGDARNPYVGLTM